MPRLWKRRATSPEWMFLKVSREMKMLSSVARKVGLGRVRMVERISVPGMARRRESFSAVGVERGILKAVQRSLNWPVAKVSQVSRCNTFLQSFWVSLD
jgi:hypothetical protein